MTTGDDSSGIRLIISDFGGVICTFDYRVFCERLARRVHRTTDQVFIAAFGDHLQAAFASGKLSGREYHRRVMARLDTEIFQPFMKGITTEGFDYRGIIYFGLMITPRRAPGA